MKFINDILKTICNMESKKILIVLSILGGIFFSGILEIYTFNEELFTSLQLFKLIILAISLEVPCYFFILFIFISLIGIDKLKEQKIESILILTGILNVILNELFIGIYFNIMKNIEIRQYSYTKIIFYIIAFAIAIIIVHVIKRNQKKNTHKCA